PDEEHPEHDAVDLAVGAQAEVTGREIGHEADMRTDSHAAEQRPKDRRDVAGTAEQAHNSSRRNEQEADRNDWTLESIERPPAGEPPVSMPTPMVESATVARLVDAPRSVSRATACVSVPLVAKTATKIPPQQHL